MIVVDSSALLAIMFGEPEKPIFEAALLSDDVCAISAVNAHETLTVLRARVGPEMTEDFWSFVAGARLAIMPFDERQVRVAAEAFDRFGKGIHSKARLNVCDCAAYALAKTSAAPLLFKGDDFSHTDIVAAV